MIADLCSGTGALSAGLISVVGGEVALFAEIDPAASKVLAHHYPEIPNLGDLTAVDWCDVGRVDWLTAGFPCQDVSHAGKRAGMGPGTRSGLWSEIARAIDGLRPPNVLLENVPGLFTLGFADVLADLDWLGYDASWCVKKASDAGAPHRRARVFVVASERECDLDRRDLDIAFAYRVPGGWVTPQADLFGAASLVGRWPWWGRMTDGVVRPSAPALTVETGYLLPTPTASCGSDGMSVRLAAERAAVRERSNLAETVVLLPPPRDGTTDWSMYAPAVARWEALTRPAPPPTDRAGDGKPRLSPRLTEWMMDAPEGWVTAVPGVSRNDALRCLGNSVVPSQAALALRCLGVN